MSKASLLFLGAGAILIFSSFVKKYQASEQLVYGIKSIRIESMDFTQTHLFVTLSVTNASTEPLQFNSFTANITASGKFLAAIDSAKTMSGLVTLSPGTTDLSFGVYIRNTDTISVLFSLIKEKKKNVNINGSIRIGAVSLPITKDLTIDLNNMNYSLSGTGRNCRQSLCTLL